MAEQSAMQKDGVTWDLTSYFPEFGGKEMDDFKVQLAVDVKSLQDAAQQLDPLSAETEDSWEALLLQAEATAARLGHLGSYIGCLTSADVTNEDYAQAEAALNVLYAEFGKFDVDALRAFKGVDDDVFEAFIARPGLKDAEHQVRRLRERSNYTMSTAEEKLNTDLSVSGFHTWGRLYDTISGKLEFDMEYPDGKKERVPISQWRSLMANVDREIGQAAFKGGNKAWEGVEDSCAYALNAIAGTRLSLNKHRGREHFLDEALFQSSIKRETLDAMYQAINDNLEIARDIFRAKSQFMGVNGIWWFEREAPLPLESATSYSWAEGSAMVERSFDTAYPALADYYRDFIAKRWIETEQRPGKRPGAFCTGSEHTREQRVYMTYNGELSDITTVAHEVGHAFHSHLLKDFRPMAQSYPMTLAETASIFAESILAKGIAEDERVSDDDKLLMLDADLCGGAILLLDITTRFEFEKAFHDERTKGEVSVSRFKELMSETQKRIMGDIMVDGGEDPMFWASKLHFYITYVSFYNFPYTFGFLLARALAAMFQKEGAAFLPKYEEFLRLTGRDTVENVAQAALGVDVTNPEFWAESIHSLIEPLELYKKLLAKKLG